MRPVVVNAGYALVAAAALATEFASSAGAYGGGASHDMWQIGISFNCDNPMPGFCDAFGGTGCFWGWGEFDRAGTQTWGDAQLTGCGHTVGGGGAGAGHTAIDVHSWSSIRQFSAGSTAPSYLRRWAASTTAEFAVLPAARPLR